ncbi:hypothetical protein HR51_23790 [Burkholderia cepacia]|nr:hypothetical protein HR51_23790 [Burkholderia cepacia]
MICPIFVLQRRKIWKLKLQLNIVEVICEGRSRQAFDVFDNKRLWAKLPNHFDSCGKHIPIVFISFVLTTDRKWLTGRTARQ